MYTGEKIKDSLEVDNFVIDFSHENKVVGVEIFNASKILSKLSLIQLNKSILSNILEASLSFYQSRELFFIVIRLILYAEKERKEVSIQVPTPLLAVRAYS